MTASDVLVERLLAWGVDTIFGLPGDGINGFMESLRNLLYGKHSHGAAATARKRPAQQAQNQAIDEAQRQARLEREQARQTRSTRRRSRSTSGGTS